MTGGQAAAVKRIRRMVGDDGGTTYWSDSDLADIVDENTTPAVLGVGSVIVSAAVIDVNAAASQTLEEWAARKSRETDIKDGDAEVKLSQQISAMLKTAAVYRGRSEAAKAAATSAVVSVPCVRSDVSVW